MIATTLILSMLIGLGESPGDADARSSRDAASEVILFDRMHDTFLLLNQVAIPAYLDHFSDEPQKRRVVQFYADRLAEVLGQGEHARDAAALEPHRAESPTTLMQAALFEARRGETEALQRYLDKLGDQPHVVLHREVDAEGLSTTAPCRLYDPQLLWVHRRLRELRSGSAAPPAPDQPARLLAENQIALRAWRADPQKREMSLRRFLDVDEHRAAVRQIAWLYRCIGVDQTKRGEPSAARESFLRAWALGDALFAVSERGRMERLDPVFLAELGDIYARLGRYDLMLRYMYSDSGLPAQFAMARPVADLARVAESVRLARRDDSAAEPDEGMPETVSQILFEEPVPRATPPTSPTVTQTAPTGRTLAWLFIGGGCALCVVAFIWRLHAAHVRPNGRTKN